MQGFFDDNTKMDYMAWNPYYRVLTSQSGDVIIEVYTDPRGGGKERMIPWLTKG